MKMALARGDGEFGGIFRRFRELVSFAESAGHEVFGVLPLATSDGEFASPVRTYCYARSRILPQIVVAESMEAVMEACEPLILALEADLRREKPDRVLAVDTDLKGVVVIEASRRAGIPVTCVVAGVATREAAFEPRPVAGYITASEHYCLTSADLLLFPSRTTARLCQEKTPQMAPFRVIYNGIQQVFLDAPRVQPDRGRVGAVMRLSAIKNPPMLGRVAEQLRERGVAVDLITGKGPRAMLAQLHAVTMVAQTHSDEELAAFYGGRRAVLCPSRFESAGNVPMEALAVGTPAVLTDQTSISELYAGFGLSHLVVRVDDVEGAVSRLMDAEPVPEAVREHLRLEFRWPAVCSQIFQAARSA